MITYQEALNTVLKNTFSLANENICIEDSPGRIAAQDVYSSLEMPPFDKAAMDGYALNTLDAKKAPLKLRCAGLIQAGDTFNNKLHRGECVKIMTGAPLPEGSSGVIMVEDTRQSGEDVELFKAVKKGENICFRGEDLKRGQRVLKKGKEVFLSDIAVLGACGERLVNVVAKPRVAILNTGGEIVPGGSLLGKNKIYNSNGPTLSALLKSDGIEPQLLGIVKDDSKRLKEAIKRGLKNDILLISGGVSMGDYDLIPGVLKEAGVREIFHKVNIKPGKPLFFGKKGKTIVFGIPGNPVSNFLAYFIFIRPALRKMTGYGSYMPGFRPGVLEKDFRSPAGRTRFVLVRISKQGNKDYLTPVNSRGSADVLALSKADGFMFIGRRESFIKRKAAVKFIMVRKVFILS